MYKTVATIRTLTLLFAATLTVQAFATDITVSMSGGTAYCSGSNTTVNYDGTGNTFTASNVFTVQLSDVNGSFSLPTIIGTLNSTSPTGSIPVKFPLAASGTGYRIRVISDSPANSGIDNGSDITLNTSLTATPTIAITADPGVTVGTGSPIYLSATISNGGSDPLIQWKRNGNNAVTGNAYVVTDPADGDQITATLTSSLSCATSSTAQSNTIDLSIDENSTALGHAWEQKIAQDPGGLFAARSNTSGFSFSPPTLSTPKIYIGCGTGTTSTYHKDLWEYDPNSNVWSQKAQLPGVGRYNAVGFSVSTKGFIGLGMTATGEANDFYQYDPTTNSWLTRAVYPGGARSEAFGFGVNGTVGKGYVGGGSLSGVNQKDFYEFDYNANQWFPKADFGGGNRAGSGSFSIGDEGFVVGGYNSTTKAYYNDLWRFDPIANSWVARASMPGKGRTRPTAFGLAGNGYVGLGYDGDTYDGSFYQYNRGTNTWSQKQYYPGPTTFTYGTGLMVGNRAFVYKDGTWFEYHLMTTTPFSSKACTNEIIPVSFDDSGLTFGANNVFAAQISPSPTFAVSLSLGTTLSSSSSGTINAKIQPSTSGTYYFRVQSSNPVLTTMLEVINITSLPTSHPIVSENGTTVCKDVVVTFTSTLDGPGFQWYKNDVAVGTDDQTYTDGALANGDMVKAVRTYTEGCKAPVGVASDPITMVVRSPDKPTITVNQPNILTSSSAANYQWYKNGDQISKATGQSFTMTEEAAYKVRIADGGGCFAFSDEIVNAFTGLEDNFALQVLAYPSPFSNDMYLSLSDDIVAQGCNFALLNELGQAVINKQTAQKINKLDLSGRNPGLYILKVSFGNNTVIRKLIKKD